MLFLKRDKPDSDDRAETKDSPGFSGVGDDGL